jgi:hypothetical protein
MARGTRTLMILWGWGVGGAAGAFAFSRLGTGGLQLQD